MFGCTISTQPSLLPVFIAHALPRAGPGPGWPGGRPARVVVAPHRLEASDDR
jgi:hypothetical protein